ncbi:MAG: tetratricopeptide repeat protein [Pirellulales bacterium]
MRFPIAVLLLLIAPTFLIAADPWIGKRVFWKQGSVAMVGNMTVSVQNIAFPSPVSEVNGEWLWVGRAWIRKSDVMLAQEALDFYTDVIRQNPSSEAWACRANVWMEKGEVENAIKDHTEAIRLDPSNAAAYNSRGIAFKSKGELDAAIKDYTEAIRLNPSSGFARNNRAAARQEKEDWDGAIQDYDEAIRIDPKDAIHYYNRGLVWLSKNDYDKAVKDFNETLRLDTRSSPAYCGRAWVLLAKGETESAIKDYTEAIRFDPAAYFPLQALANIKATCAEDHLRNGKEAVELATKSCELTAWKNWDCLNTLAAASAEMGDFESAIKWQEKAIELSPSKSKQEYSQNLELYKAGKTSRTKKKM